MERYVAPNMLHQGVEARDQPEFMCRWDWPLKAGRGGETRADGKDALWFNVSR